MSRLHFQIEAEATGSRARAAVFQTLHGEVRTPIFMPVGTLAAQKCGMTVDDLRELGSRILLANTYHLRLQPGPEVFEKFGGIHRFMRWDGPVLTDSGGFQIFSLPKFREMAEHGARFQNPSDGREVFLSPEESIRMQIAIGSDIMMVLDQCIPSTAERPEALAAMELTHRWAARSLAARGDSKQAMFGIVQGACFPDLRRQSAETLTAMPFDGFAIGGLAVGETKAQREDFTELTAALLPRDRPRYLMGVGTPSDILEAVHRGVDMFDCILPAQVAQRSAVYTSVGRLQLRRDQYQLQDEALDPNCACSTCRRYSRAYLSHLYRAEEESGWRLLAHHNLAFYQELMRDIRGAIVAGNFAEFYRERREQLALTDNVATCAPPPRRTTPPRQGDYEIQISPRGFASVRQRSSGEVMHSVSEPSEEAHLLYVEQSALARRLGEPTDEKLVIWDVGLGAATNAMAAVRCFEALAQTRPLQIISFERDLDPLRLVLRQHPFFPHVHHRAPHALLKNGRWEHPSGRLEWVLLEGDFLQTMESAPAADLIFYDPFSAKTDGPLWTREVFARVHGCCRPQAALYTYSASTAVRAALLAAGFHVARGVGTGPKEETTVAFSSPPEAATNWLDERWLQRWQRSDARYPNGLTAEARAEFNQRILNHDQFRPRTERIATPHLVT